MSSYSRIQLESWIKTIDVSGRVIDIGGSQKPIKGRTKTWDASEYKILDLVYPHEQQQSPDIIEDIQRELFIDFHDDYTIKYFDIAFCIEVAEYWYDPFQALKNINLVLKQGGKLYISFHFIYPHHSPENADYLRYTRSGVRRLLKEAGFEIDEIRPKLYANPQMVKMMYDNEGMKGIGKNSSEIHREQGWLVSATKV